MTIHNYPGQAEQNSRLIIWGTVETYVGRFTGQPEIVPVTVGADVNGPISGNFPLDGSDFVIDPWTSVTAFSHRSACVADGILFFWGPKGIHRDDGVATPTRISQDLEPDIFNLYDPNRTDEICSVFNPTTHEITWFYPPKDDIDGFETHCIIYHTQSRKYLFGKYKSKIDAIWNLEVTSPGATSGQRTVIAVRENSGSEIQRAYYYDFNNRSGDMGPRREFMVKSFTAPTPATRVLTLAAGFDPIMLSTIAVGDKICLQQATRYTDLGIDDMIASVTAIGANTITIEIPSDAVMPPAATLGRATYFPVYQAGKADNDPGINGIPWMLSTKYWMPGGVNAWGYWLYCYFLLKLNLFKSVLAQVFTFGHRTPISAALLSRDITFADNSNGNQQIYAPLTPDNQGYEGNALKLVLSGTHIGSEWVLQYLEGHQQQVDGDQLKMFEG
jgi:hypothetical protein